VVRALRAELAERRLHVSVETVWRFLMSDHLSCYALAFRPFGFTNPETVFADFVILRWR